MRAVEIGVGFGELAMLGFKVFELLLQTLHVLFFALAECTLRGAILGSSALRGLLVSDAIREGKAHPGARERGRVTHDAHVGHGFLILGGGGTPLSPAVVFRGGQIHELDRIDHRRLGFGVLWHALGVGV